MAADNSRRYETLFEGLQKQNEGAFIPFVMLGDPNPEACFAIVETLIANGADGLELGIPFSDPIADGPVIQTAANRALAAGVTPEACLQIVARVRGEHPNIPIGLLVYANLVIGKGAEHFYDRAHAAGVDSVLVADAPTVAGAYFRDAALAAGIDPVYIVPPNADEDKLREIAGLTQGYTYYLGRAGVTGADRELEAPGSGRIDFLKRAGAPPIVVGFGISKPEHIRASLAAGAAGGISGSATVAIVEKCLHDNSKLHAELSHFTREMKAATKR